MNLPIKGKVNLAITGFLSNNETQTFNIVRPLIEMGKYKCRLTAVVKENMSTNVVSKGLKQTADYLMDKGIKLADKINSDVVGPIHLIIGSDYCGRFLRKMVRKHSIQLVSSSGGHLIMGTLPFFEENTDNKVNSVYVTPAQSLMIARIGAEIVPSQIGDIIEEQQEPVHKLWDLDTIGIETESPAPEDILTYNHFLDTVEYKEGQYWVGLPWKLNTPELPSNYQSARSQLNKLLDKLRQKHEQQEQSEISDLRQGTTIYL